MKTWIVSSLDEETIQGEETIWGNTVDDNLTLYILDGSEVCGFKTRKT